MNLVKEWREGAKIPQGISYRKYFGNSFNRFGLYVTVWRVSLQLEAHKYKPTPVLLARASPRPSYTVDFMIALL